ncbi:hydrogenase expression/formation protein HypE [cyanobacterium endosymbiont of Epithemia turgida]|uniref:hydrogenase expression/formation protein HypE n=1 Tax=cyanobacterium endosymbiont of Epithemia turgida TaxID=718217 RepID=UPI0004D0DC00|nr:hydrogenase expression/formation protein HypE [cyanobacterium endosymbiont of Epithemia turgida]BAP18087.1 hydrogenase expression/formation protein [cyanobacterium endosymbiont of Epithemia turgida isolate EtSB Lake Yunoko]
MTDFNLTCPIALDQYPQVLLAHGGGGKLMQQLLEKMIFPVFNTTQNTPPHDSAIFDLNTNKIAFTTDSYVIHPLFFPGGDIGSLAINGTVNDLAMSGARPLYISVGLILEEGLPMEILWNVVQSLQNSAQIAQVKIITGDTKVVDRGKGDGVFINTAGIGIIEHDQIIAAQSVQPGDTILVNGDLGRHGIAIMAVREGLEFETTIESDCTPLNSVILAMLEARANIHCLRDLTRGGLASALNEIAMGAGVILNIQENAIPVREDVQGACEILGFDPLYVANEGRFVAFIPQDSVDIVMKIMRSHQQNPCIIGQVTGRGTGMGLVTLESKIGASRIVDMLSGEQLPRIC